MCMERDSGGDEEAGEEGESEGDGREREDRTKVG